MNTKQLLDLRISLSGKMSRSAFWMQTLMLTGLTLLVLVIWALLVTGKLSSVFMDIMNTSGDFGHSSPEDILGGWQTWALGIYGVWLLVTAFCMQVRRMRDVGRGVLLPVLWWVLSVGGIAVCVGFSGNESMITVGGFMIIAAGIVGLILLVFTLLGSKVVEGEEAAPPVPAAAWGLALVPCALGMLLYVTCVSNWVEFFKGSSILGQDEAAAMVHINRAAESGNKIAKYMLLVNAAMKGDPEALPEVRKLAESGQAFWQFMLSGMYAGGYPGLEQNRDEALIWLKKSADQGCQPAIEQLKTLSE